MIRVPQIVAIGAELIKKVMISDFKHFVDNGFGCQVCLITTIKAYVHKSIRTILVDF